MTWQYNTLNDFLNAFDADPVLYAEIDTSSDFSSIEFWVSVRGLVLDDGGGNYTAYRPHVNQFGDIIDLVSQDIQPTGYNITLDAIEFQTTLIGKFIRIYIGSSQLDQTEHQLLFVGTVLSETRSGGSVQLIAQDNIYALLSRSFLPKFVIKNDSGLAASAPASAINSLVPEIAGSLVSPTGAIGRIKAIPITNVAGPAANNWLICEEPAGTVANVTAAWQNGSPAAIAFQTVIAGPAFRYRRITINASDPADEITVDVDLDTDKPFDELRLFLNRNGIPDTKLDLTSFTDAQTIADSRLYLLGGKITESTQLLQIIGDWLKSFGAEAVLSGGILGVRLRDYSIDLTVPDFTEHGEIYEGSFSLGLDTGNIINSVSYEAVFDPDGDALVKTTLSDAASIATYGNRESSLSMPWAKNEISATDVAQRHIFDRKGLRGLISFTTRLKALTVDLTDYIRATASNIFRHFLEIKRLTLSGTSFSVNIEALDVDDLLRQACRLGADQSKAADIPHNLTANDPRNSNVIGSIDEGGTLTTSAGNDVLSLAGSSSDFVTAGVLVGDYVYLFQTAGGGIPVNIGIYEIYSFNANTLFVQIPGGGAVSFIGLEIITFWWVARSWATANETQRLQCHLADGAGQMSDGSDGYQLI